MITNEWWDALWLKEGFASYWPYVALPETAPWTNLRSGWRITVAAAMLRDEFATSPPLTGVAVTSSGVASAQFNVLQYDKGAVFVAALQRRCESVAPGAFLPAIGRFIRTNAYSAIAPAALIAALADACGVVDLAEEMASLMYQPGVPLITASWERPGVLRLTQSRYFASPASAAAAVAAAAAAGGSPPSPWTIALTISAGSPSAQLRASMVEANAVLRSRGGYANAFLTSIAYDPAHDGWLTLTDGSAADYVRVAFPPQALVALAAALEAGTPPLPTLDVIAAIVDDLFALAESRTDPRINMSFALAWAASWATAPAAAPFMAAPQVRTAFTNRVARLNHLLVDDVPLALAGTPAVAPAAVTPGTAAYLCWAGFRAFAELQLGIPPPGTLMVNRTALAASLLTLPAAGTIVDILLNVAAQPAGRDLAWSRFQAIFPTVQHYLTDTSALAGLARGIAWRFVSTEYADAVHAFWSAGEGVNQTAAIFSASLAEESIRAAAAWRASADATDFCAFLMTSDRMRN